MDKRNLISVTLLISALAFNPLVAQQLNANTTNSQRQINTVSSSIASILYKRGLDEDAAREISNNLVDEEDELFAFMIDNLLNECKSVSKEEILEYLSTAALFRQDVHFDSYTHLVSMVSKIKQKSLDKKTLTKLSAIAKQNKEIFIS
jgi:Na+-transporting NADH:ubiquinone oxidoreductase subunit NqrC